MLHLILGFDRNFKLLLIHGIVDFKHFIRPTRSYWQAQHENNDDERTMIQIVWCDRAVLTDLVVVRLLLR